MSTTPYAESRLAKYIDRRIKQLYHKTQTEIAREAGFPNANFVSMLKTGNAKLALDRVPAFAKALEDDPAMIMRLAIEQTHGPEMLMLITDLLSEPLTDNERAWLKLIRDSSSNTDPAPARTIVRVLRLFLHDTEAGQTSR